MPINFKFLTNGNDFYSHAWETPATWVVAMSGDGGANVVSGGADTVDGGSGNDMFWGDGRDVLIGGSGNDIFNLDYFGDGAAPITNRVIESAGGGWDTLLLHVRYTGTFDLMANVENLTLIAHEFGDYYLPEFTLRGNDLNNVIVGSHHSDTIEGGLGDDALHGGGWFDDLSGGAGNDYLVGGNNPDIMTGGSGRDTMDGVAGEDAAFADTMAGGADNDTYDVGWNDVVIEYAYQGWDTVRTAINSYSLINHFEELLYTGSSAANLTGNAFANLIHASQAWTGTLTINGGEGNDTVRAAGGNDVLNGEGGNDSVAGGAGNDVIRGGLGNDRLDGDGGNDSLLGDAGHDVLRGGEGNDILSGLADNDTLEGAAGNDILEGGDGHDRLDGGTENDSLRGGAGGDTMYGGSGEDTIFGDSGNDFLAGGAGKDMLLGGAGRDTLQGDAGFDSFIFTKTSDSMAIAADRINSFDGNEDLINLVGIDADGGYGAYDKFTYVGDAPVAGIKGALWITSGPGGFAVFGDVNGDGLAEMRIDVWTSGSFGIENILV
jgi:Ca2+-binding RTX toxin-like protein